MNLVPTDSSRVVEPFCGSAAVFFALKERTGWLSDINTDLIDAYCWIRDRPEELHAQLAAISTDPTTYYDLRSALSSLSRGLERSMVFLHLNRLAFNGLFRTNKHGEFNVPYGGTSPAALAPLSAFHQWAARLRCARVDALDYREVLAQVTSDDFVYLDPPYATASARVFGEYHPSSFGIDDLPQFRDTLSELDARGIRFTLSFSDSPEGRLLAKPFSSSRLHVRRSIAGFAHSRLTVSELAIRNWE